MRARTWAKKRRLKQERPSKSPLKRATEYRVQTHKKKKKERKKQEEGTSDPTALQTKLNER